MNFYQVISRKQIENDILIFHEVVNKFQTTASDLAKDSKLSLQIAKSTFDIVRRESPYYYMSFYTAGMLAY